MPNYPLLLTAECNSTAQFRSGVHLQNAVPQEGLTSVQLVGNKPWNKGQILGSVQTPGKSAFLTPVLR